MPISAIDGCTSDHWSEVLELIEACVTEAEFIPQMVSDADEVGIIQNRIVQNLYENPIAVCDVSGRNPNVMFELGMRLAFDKPTVIIKDDKTPYSFDTGLIEHIEYPRDLRYGKISIFRAVLIDKLKATFERAKADADYSVFLGKIGVRPAVARPNLAIDNTIITELSAIKRHLGATRKTVSYDGASTLCVRGAGLNSDAANKISERLLKVGITNFAATFVGQEHVHFTFPVKTTFPEELLRELADELKVSIRLNPGGATSWTDDKGHLT